MRYFLLYFLVTSLLSAGSIAAQPKLSLEPRLSYGTFKMEQLKELQQYAIRISGVNAKVTDSYGPFFQYGLNTVGTFGKYMNVGVFAEIGSTGGRVDYQDYSGELRVDTRLNYTAYGLMLFGQKEIGESKLSAVGGIEASMIFSKLRLYTNFRTDPYTSTYDEKFDARGKGYKAFAGLQYPVLTIPIRFTIGYLADNSKAFYDPDSPDDYVAYREDNSYKLHPNWSGLRLNLSVSVPIWK